MSMNPNQSIISDEIVQPVRMQLSVSDVPNYFDRDTLCSMDIIAYVRRNSRCPDPRIPVILDADCAPFDRELLAGNKIFWGGPRGNEDQANFFSGLSSNVYLPIYPDEFDLTQEDYGIVELASSFGAKYNLRDYTVLLCGEITKAEDDPLAGAWDYICSSYSGHLHFDTTVRVAERLRKLSDGIDIAEYVDRIRALKATNELNYASLTKIISEIGERIDEMRNRGVNPRVQCLTTGHTQDVQLLLLYLPLRFNLSPLYVEAYLQSYVDFKFNYDYKKLSMYERFMWTRNLPDEFGYLGPNVKFFCFCTLSDEGLFIVKKQPDAEEVELSQHFGQRMSKSSAKRVYPRPVYAAYVNMQSRETIMFKPDVMMEQIASGEFGSIDSELASRLMPHLRLFEFLNYGDVAPLFDFRKTFPGSVRNFTTEPNARKEDRGVARSDAGNTADKQSDEMWRRVFVSMAEQVRAEYGDEIYPTVKNCVLYGLSQSEMLLLYCPGSIGITCKFSSEYFDKDIQIIGEEDFHRFIDMRTLLALIEKTPLTGEQSFQEGNKRFAEIITLEHRNLDPALDYDVMLALNLLTAQNNGLSYYDKMLRSTVNIMPIVTDEDNPLYVPSELLKHFTYLNLLSADNSTRSLTTITCFGTLEDDVNTKPVLQTTIESYRGCKLI